MRGSEYFWHAKYSDDQPFLVLRKPITSSVFSDDFDVGRSEYRLRRKLEMLVCQSVTRGLLASSA